jgi:Flp pilus assembly protein TadD
MVSDATRKAQEALAEGRVEEASRLLRLILSQDPGDSSANLLLGAIYVRAGRFEDSLPILRKADEFETGRGKAALWLSRALRNLEHN